jgi:hypothetical protein
MNAFLKYTLILAVGALLGVVGMVIVNNVQHPVEDGEVAQQEIDDTTLNPKKKKKARKKLNEPDTSSLKEDSIVVETLDSINMDSLLIVDTLGFNEDNEEYFEIVTERLITQRSVVIQVIQPDTVDSSDLLNLKADSYSKKLTVEFWESPLELIGYELNRSRLKLFGFNSEEELEVKRMYDSEKLQVTVGTGANRVELTLEKTPKFKSIILK